MNAFVAILHSRKGIPALFLTALVVAAFVMGRVELDQALNYLMGIWAWYATLTAGEDMAYKLGRSAPDPVSADQGAPLPPGGEG